ncbi:MAG TPA: hypothetical protein DCY48_04415 [Candidatus Magasanikbacteria bacterium]|nr:MAG: hypothetical protein A3I74_01530 [Candidatus Magasanikbacteria bacterium RIFCSPLOWO2_02_FULL_47_16]OGH79840.1 MAG: hypothetical protein A3C10_00035 [Candidatus Magasanikbacteria bacterium RIFCSPHIGHO2_02_FULL_48_18]OGH82080.1 MAG: hypothetical protein A3G08_04240 [Candidatus Magasanikbacteria bacterium RIFCSPLOWO2_12_FULL_47_9b]HAZ28986.1 hypothetical protein [Candidatus Magasanikbacteria bacterium]
MKSHEKKVPPDSSLLRRLQEKLLFMRHCPLCKKEYEREARVHVLYEERPIELVHITCSQCRNAVLAILAVSELGVSSVGLYTDLTAEDVVRFYSAESLAEDDVLSFHTVLHKQGKQFGHSVCRARSRAH